MSHLDTFRAVAQRIHREAKASEAKHPKRANHNRIIRRSCFAGSAKRNSPVGNMVRPNNVTNGAGTTKKASVYVSASEKLRSLTAAPWTGSGPRYRPLLRRACPRSVPCSKGFSMEPLDGHRAHHRTILLRLLFKNKNRNRGQVRKQRSRLVIVSSVDQRSVAPSAAVRCSANHRISISERCPEASLILQVRPRCI